MLTTLTEVRIDKSLEPAFNAFGFSLRRAGLLGRYTDLTIAFLARHHAFPLYSFDGYFRKLAEKGWLERFEP